MERTTHSAFATATLDYRSRRSVPAGKALTLLWGLLPVLAFLLHAVTQAQVSVPYTSSGTFLVPAGVTQVTVECWGGGGRGATRSSSGQGGGGGGGAYARSTVSVTPGNSYTVTVGAGSTTTSPGGDSWFGTATTVMAKGGGSSADNSINGAAGGSAASSIGTVKFSGGAGATTASANSGGGGSSAGTAANGANGAVTAGGNAPAGGGDGGNGVTGNSNGNDGAFPGGGGGGAKRTTGTRTGGSGGGGFVRVSYTYTAGTCMGATSATEIPDNSCGTTAFTVGIPISGLPTTLGTGAGNALLSSVGLIISHTYNSDLEITLTSPSGTTRNLILDRFGNGDNLGDPSNCPTDALLLQDGGTALNNTNTSNVTGTYAPEQTLAGFTGNPNGTWILSICDDANVDVGNLRYVNLDFCTVPSVAAAGPDQGICAGQTATLAANAPTYGTGAWSVVSGPSTSSAQFSSTSANNAVFTPAGGLGTYTLRWTISSGSCSASSDDVVITVQDVPATPTMTPTSVSICSGNSTALSASAANVAVTRSGGAVSIVNGGSSPYPSTFSISGWPTSGVTVTSVTLNGMLHNNPTDIDILLRSPNGTNVVLMSDVGGGANLTGNDYTFQDGASAMTGSFNASGTYAPTNSGASDTYTTLGTVTQGSPSLASFSGNPNGTWGLYAMDDNNNGTNGSLTGWSVTFDVPLTFAWSPATGLSPITGTSVTCSATSSQTYTVTITHPETGCQSTNTVAVTVADVPTTANAGPDQSICTGGASTTMAANSPTAGTGTWSQIAGPVSASITTASSPTTAITGLSAIGTYTFRWTIANSPCTASTDDVDVVVGACTYYSQSSGDVSDPIWSLLPVGTPGAATFDALTNMVVQSGHTITNDASNAVNDLNVDNGGTLVLASATTLSVNGASAAINGTLTASDNSELALDGTAATALTLAAATSFFDLTVNTPSGTTLTGTARIRGTLLLQDGDFDCTSNPVVLRSTATYTGRLGPVATTASYTGNIRMERYIPAGATNWRLIGSPVAGRTVYNLQDDFFTAGYPGSAYPGFSDPPGSGINWPSIRWYDETNTGTNVNDGLVGVSGHTQSLTPGQGFAAWCGTNLTTTTAFTIDLEGGAPVIASTPIALPVTYTNTGNPTVDGWNLVANPLPSPIAFDQIARGADVEDFVTFFDPATGNSAVYDISLGFGTNGASNTIQSMQGFYLKASGPAVSTSVDEADKVAGNTGGFFGGTEEAPATIGLHITSAINSFSDEALVLFSQGSPAVDGDDVPKMFFSHPQAPQVATQGASGVALAINAYGPYSADISVPVLVQAGVAGSYTITVTGVESAGLSCLKLEDLMTGSITPLSEGSTYTFELTTGDGMSAPRFLLHATAPLDVLSQGPACYGGNNGNAQLELGDELATVLWMNDMGQTLLEQQGITGTAALSGVGHGDYQVLVSGYKGCAALTTVFSVTQPDELLIDATVIEASCPDMEDGGVELVISGGDAPYGVQWSTGATSLDLSAGPGAYSAVVSDANGCEIAIGDFTVISGPAPEALASVVSTTVLTGEEVQFTSTSDDASTFAWDFGDGNTSDEQNPQHVFEVPGTFQVTLSVSNGTCSSSTVIEMNVEVSTGVSEMSQGSMSAWLNGDNLVVEHGFADQYPLLLEVMNEAGQLHQQYRVAGPAGRLTIPAAELSSGIWYLRVSNQELRRTIPVVVVR